MNAQTHQDFNQWVRPSDGHQTYPIQQMRLLLTAALVLLAAPAQAFTLQFECGYDHRNFQVCTGSGHDPEFGPFTVEVTEFHGFTFTFESGQSFHCISRYECREYNN